MMNPENIGGHDVNATSLHLKQFFAPLILRTACEVEFAHDGRPWLSVEQQAAAIQRQRGAVGAIRCAHFETFSYRRLWAGNGDGVAVRNGNRRGKNGKARCQGYKPYTLFHW